MVLGQASLCLASSVYPFHFYNSACLPFCPNVLTEPFHWRLIPCIRPNYLLTASITFTNSIPFTVKISFSVVKPLEITDIHHKSIRDRTAIVVVVVDISTL
ncbi:hypothetical protein L873DRAFT_291816 [Choiromyces venosus 120613-1]|uniref:Uncharacterized protein n=1 Tax=Choiromyces venosus 120613-1 TaxID=1336337 RepID=A0A3N4J098_9PEZI|nr:hypothetical protein L873DRAFT_291816 [Choiromyces venosus 120613-1]